MNTNSSTNPSSSSTENVRLAIQALQSGQMIIMTDNEDRENEGDFVCAAENVTPDMINFMAKYGRGLICLALDEPIIEQLQLPLMKDHSKDQAYRETAFTVSIEAKEGVSTGISAADRAHTIRTAVAPQAKPADLVVPGHIFPLKARAGGVLERAGHTEGSVDLAKIAGFRGAGVICEIMNEDGTMARKKDLEGLAERFEMPILSISDLIAYRLEREEAVTVVHKVEEQGKDGEPLIFYLIQWLIDGSYHVAVQKGSISGKAVTDVRVHAQMPVLDIFSLFKDQNPTNRYAMVEKMLQTSEEAVFVFLDIKMNLKEQFEQFFDMTTSRSTKALERQVGVGSHILAKLGVKRMRVHANASMNYRGLKGFGLEVEETLTPDDER